MPNDPRRRRLTLFFVATYLAQGLAGIAYEPISYLLKDVLRLGAGQSAAFTAVMTLPFLLKPLLGLLTDAVPILRLRRRPYLLAASALACSGWAALAASPGYALAATLLLLTLINASTALADAACDAVMVQEGARTGGTGTLQAVQIGTLYGALLAAGLGGGWLAEHASYRTIFGLTSLFPALILLTSLAVPDPPCEALPVQSAKSARACLGVLLDRGFWALGAVIFLFGFNPFQGAPMFFFQSGDLGFSKVFIGALTSISGAFGVLGAALFHRAYGRSFEVFGRRVLLDTAFLVRWSVALGGPLTLAYLAYRGPWSAGLSTAFFGCAGVFMRLSLMDAAARMSPENAEATAFALFMGIFNLAASASNAAGGRLFDLLTRGPVSQAAAMDALVLVSAACTLAAWPLLRWFPRAGRGSRQSLEAA
jgi:hypothetical protein